MGLGWERGNVWGACEKPEVGRSTVVIGEYMSSKNEEQPGACGWVCRARLFQTGKQLKGSG